MNLPEITKKLCVLADELDAVKATAPQPIQTLAQDQVELTSEMHEAANRVLAEELQQSDPYAELKTEARSNKETLKQADTSTMKFKLWSHLHNEHGLTLIDDELYQIIRIVQEVTP